MYLNVFIKAHISVLQDIAMCSVNHTSNNNTVILSGAPPSASTIRIYFASTNMVFTKGQPLFAFQTWRQIGNGCVSFYKNFKCMPAYDLWLFLFVYLHFIICKRPVEILTHGDRIIFMGPWNTLQQPYLNRIGILSLISMCVLWKLIIDSFTKLLMHNPQSLNKSRAVQYQWLCRYGKYSSLKCHYYLGQTISISPIPDMVLCWSRPPCITHLKGTGWTVLKIGTHVGYW